MTPQAVAKIPNLVKHCAVAIYDDLTGNPIGRFRTALIYAISRLSEYGFLTEGSKEAAADKVQLTSKGKERERLHVREGRSKSARFDKLFGMLTRHQDSKKLDGKTAPPAAQTHKKK